MITAENFTSHELIGSPVKVIESTNHQIIGLKGQIIDETKSMFKIKTGNGSKMIPKKHNILEFSIQDRKISVNGDVLAKRPFDRIGVKN